MTISLQKLSQSILAVSLLSSPLVHAADVATSATITTTVKNPTKLVAEYVRKNTIYTHLNNEGRVIGILSVSGYAPQTSGNALRFTDSAGVSNALTFTNVADPSKYFRAKMRFNGKDYTPSVNGGIGQIMDDLPDEKADFHIAISNSNKPIVAGEYSDIIEVTLVNQ